LNEWVGEAAFEQCGAEAEFENEKTEKGPGELIFLSPLFLYSFFFFSQQYGFTVGYSWNW
jgi:hypothetical protein